MQAEELVRLGRSDESRLLVVVYTDRAVDTLRVISAWNASYRQRASYEENRR